MLLATGEQKYSVIMKSFTPIHINKASKLGCKLFGV